MEAVGAESAPRTGAAAAEVLAQFSASTHPYPGLRPFHREESDIFFGRETLVDELLRRLSRSRFLGVVGVSGCGKSSLLRAGLVPGLETGFLSQAGVRWSIAEMRPGTRPMRQLANALDALRPETEDDVDHAPLIEAGLRRGPKALPEVLRTYGFSTDTNLLLVVDQFEEIFRYRRGGDRDDADAFVALLLESVKQGDFPVFLILAMRSDYLGECALFPGLPEALNDSQFLTPRLTREQREAAIVGPAGVFGAKIAAPLVNQLLNDMGADPDQLPVMQHLLMRMWDSASVRAGGAPRELTLDDYRATGGFGEALSRHVDEVFKSLPTDEHRRIAEILFRCATEHLDNKQDSRRPVKIGDIAAVADVPWRKVADVVEVFRQPGSCFLLPPVGVSLDEDKVVDITHESLIRQWGKLRDWVRDEALSAERFRNLVGAARNWEAHGKRWRYLLRAPDLDDALGWRNTTRPSEAWARRYGGALDLVQELLAKSLRRRRLARAAGAMVVVLALAGAALWGRERAQRAAEEADRLARDKERAEVAAKREANIALASDLAANANQTRGLKLGLLDTSTLLAVEADKRMRTLQSNLALRESLRLMPQPAHHHPYSGSRVQFTADGRLLAGDAVAVRSLDGDSDAATTIWSCPDCLGMRLLAIHPNGRFLVGSNSDETRVVDAQTGKFVGRPLARGTAVDQAAVSADGRTVAMIIGSRVEMASTDGGRRREGIALPERGTVALSPSAHYVAVRDPSSEFVDLRDLEAKDRRPGKDAAYVYRWRVGSAEVTHLAFSPDEKFVAAAMRDGVIRVWNLETFAEVTRVAPSNYPTAQLDLALGWEASSVALVSREAIRVFIRVFDLRERKTPREMARIENIGVPRDIAFSRDGRHLAATGSWGLAVWKLVTGGEVNRFLFESPVVAIALSPDKQYLATGTLGTDVLRGVAVRVEVDEPAAGGHVLHDSHPEAGTVSLWDVASGAQLFSLPVEGKVRGLQFGPDAASVQVARDDVVERITFHPISTGAPQNSSPTRYATQVEPQPLDCGAHTSFAAFSGDGTRVAMKSALGSLCIFDAATGTRLTRLASPPALFAFSRLGQHWALIHRDRKLHAWASDGARPAPRSPSSAPDRVDPLDVNGMTDIFVAPAPPLALAMNPGGTYVALSTLQPGVEVRGLSYGSTSPKVPHDSVVESLAFGQRDTLLVTGGRDGSARIWDLPIDGDGAKEVTRIPHSHPVVAVALSSDDEYLVTASDRVVRVLYWRGEDLRREACARLSHPLSAEDWTRYLPGVERTATCNGLVDERTTDEMEEKDVLERARRRLTEGRIPEAIALYEQAERERIRVNDWNALCWNGAIWGYPKEVLPACEKAVKGSEGGPFEASRRDSRGLARALSGDRRGAIEDFRSFVAAKVSESRREQRKAWIQILEAGGDPFRPEDMRDLFGQ